MHHPMVHSTLLFTTSLHPPLSAKQYFFMQNLISPILGALSLPSWMSKNTFVWLTIRSELISIITTITERDKRSTPLFWAILKCPSSQSLSVSFLAGTRPSSNTDQDTFQMQQNGNQENIRVSWCIFDAVHLFSINSSPVTLMETSRASF